MQELICVLDVSGSMQGTRDDAVGGFNTFIEEQQKLGEINTTIFWFDDKFKLEYTGDIAGVKPLKQWPSGGSTALHDAIGKAFEHVKERFSKEKPEKVIMAILTDGGENASRKFTKDAVATLIKIHEDNFAWEVIFLAADQDAVAVGTALNMKAENIHNYDSKDTRRGFAAMSQTVGSYRN